MRVQPPRDCKPKRITIKLRVTKPAPKPIIGNARTEKPAQAKGVQFTNVDVGREYAVDGKPRDVAVPKKIASMLAQVRAAGVFLQDTETVTALHLKLRNAKTRRKALTKELKTVRAELDETQLAFGEAQEQLKKAPPQAEFDELQRDVDALAEELEERPTQEEYRALYDAHADIIQRHADMTGAHDAVVEENASLQETIREQQAQIAALTATCNAHAPISPPDFGSPFLSPTLFFDDDVEARLISAFGLTE